MQDPRGVGTFESLRMMCYFSWHSHGPNGSDRDKALTKFLKSNILKSVAICNGYLLMFYFTSFAIEDLLGIPFAAILIGFIALHVTAGMIMSTVFQMAHVVEGTNQVLADKEHKIKSDWLVHQLKTTSDFMAIISFIVAILLFVLSNSLSIIFPGWIPFNSSILEMVL